jgi:hypothetical protein
MGTGGQYTVAAYGSVASKSLDADCYVSTPPISDRGREVESRGEGAVSS